MNAAATTRHLGIALTASLALGCTVGYLGFPASSRQGVPPALLLVALNGLATHLLYGASLRARTSEAFLCWGLGGGAVRTLVLLVAALAAHQALGPAFMPFLATLGTGYFAFLSYELLHLHINAAVTP
jgi:hypothetical protein